MKAFHVCVLRRFSWLDMHQLDLLLDAPRQKMPAGQLWPVVTANRLRFPRSATIPSNTRVTLRLAKLVSTSNARMDQNTIGDLQNRRVASCDVTVGFAPPRFRHLFL